MEREFYDYDAWQRSGADPTYGQGASDLQSIPLANPYVAPEPASTPTTTAPTTSTSSRHPNAGPDGSNQPNMDPPGFMGGYWMNGQWVQGSPRTGSGYTPGGPNPYEFGGEGDFDPSSFQWTPFNAPTYGGYQEFQANPFEAPDPAQTADDPWLKFALDQGTKQLENSAAYQGMVRSGMNKARVLEHGVNFTRQFGNDVWNRALQGWQANEDNRFRAWGGNRQNSLDTFDRSYRGASDSFNATRDAEKMDFNARLQQWRDRLNATTQVATAGLDR